jgi:hypothetical protein
MHRLGMGSTAEGDRGYRRLSYRQLGRRHEGISSHAIPRLENGKYAGTAAAWQGT